MEITYIDYLIDDRFTISSHRQDILHRRLFSRRLVSPFPAAMSFVILVIKNKRLFVDWIPCSPSSALGITRPSITLAPPLSLLVSLAGWQSLQRASCLNFRCTAHIRD